MFPERKLSYCRAVHGKFLAVLLVSCLVSCKAGPVKEPDPPPSDPSVFYSALKAESRSDTERAADLFEKALESPSFKIRQEAALKLASLLFSASEHDGEKGIKKRAERILKRLENKKKDTPEDASDVRDAEAPAFVSLKASALYIAEKYGELIKLYEDTEVSPWSQDAALFILSRYYTDRNENGLDALRGFLYAGRETNRNREQDELSRRVLDELEKHESVLPEPDLRAVDGRFALSLSNYDEALFNFEAARRGDPSLFIRYPGLLGDLGRVFQWVSSKRAEGLKLFGDWETALRQKPESLPGAAVLSAKEKDILRYYLLFYSGRIVRQQGKEANSIDIFARALDLAPDEQQEDACIWYILNATLHTRPENMTSAIKKYARRWHSTAYFSDIIDRLCCYLAGEKKWSDMGEILPFLHDGDAAQYAYILGRAVSEGYIPGRGKKADDYFTIAYEEGNASFYYKALAASRLGKAVIPLKDLPDSSVPASRDAVLLEFYRGFFDYNAENFALNYLRRDSPDLSAPVLRAAAGILAGSGRYLDSIGIVRIYMRREGYQMDRSDLELYYPRAFAELVDPNARGAGIKPPVFYGLIRTESAFMPAIVSRAGAVGLAQIMPSTAKEVNTMIKRQTGTDFSQNGSIDLTNPETNLYMGAYYLSYLTKSLQSPMLALLAYNGGPARIRRLRRAAPSLPEDLFLETIAITETREYGKRVMAAAAAYGYLYFDMPMEEVVAGIFN